MKGISLAITVMLMVIITVALVVFTFLLYLETAGIIKEPTTIEPVENISEEVNNLECTKELYRWFNSTRYVSKHLLPGKEAYYCFERWECSNGNPYGEDCIWHPLTIKDKDDLDITTYKLEDYYFNNTYSRNKTLIDPYMHKFYLDIIVRPIKDGPCSTYGFSIINNFHYDIILEVNYTVYNFEYVTTCKEVNQP